MFHGLLYQFGGSDLKLTESHQRHVYVIFIYLFNFFMVGSGQISAYVHCWINFAYKESIIFAFGLCAGYSGTSGITYKVLLHCC